MSGRSLEDIQDEILDALHGGEPIDRAAIVAQNPEHADALRRFFDLVAVIETPAEPKPAEPSRLGEFEIIREIGRGGMGVVYEARQVSLNRKVALKVLPPAMRSDRRLLTRFQREAEAAARLRHPNIVPVYSIGESAGAPFFAMELVEGRSLAEIIKLRKAGDDAGLPKAGADYRRWAVSTVARIADALDYAHGRGILHRDVKPGNILIEADGTPRLTDFGLALDLQASELTQTGEMFGSPLYMSPEQAFRREAPVDARTDIYSLAVTLYELLTLRLPYHGTTHAELMSALSSGKIVAPRLADPDCPEPLERVLVQALRSDPHDRYATAGTFAVDLRAALERPQDVRAVAAAPGSRTAKSADGQGAPDDSAGHTRWARLMGFFLIVAGLALLLFGRAPAPGIAWVFFLGGLALWAWESWSLSRRPVGAGGRTREPEPDQPMRGLVARVARGRWGPAVGGGLLFLALLIHLNDGPILLVVGLIVLGFLMLKQSGIWSGLRGDPAQDRPAGGAPPQGAGPEGEGRWHRWRRERPIFSGWAVGCGCLGLLLLGFAFIAAILTSHDSRSVRVSESFDLGHGSRGSSGAPSTGEIVIDSAGGITVIGLSANDAIIERFRALAVPYDLSPESIASDRSIAPPRSERLEDYPSRLWAPLLGGPGRGVPDVEDFEESKAADLDLATGPGVIVLEPVKQRFASRDEQVLMCPAGITLQGGVTAQEACALFVGGAMAGRCVFDEDATLVVDGDLSGTVQANANVTAVVTGDLTGHFTAQDPCMLYVEGRVLGTVEFVSGGKLYVGGRMEKAEIDERISGPATIFLEESDLEAGTATGWGQFWVNVAPRAEGQR